MEQRMTKRTWSPASLSGQRPRLLIEDDRPALAISDFSVFRDAGLDVAFCSGPGDDPGSCPLLRGQRCALVDRAELASAPPAAAMPGRDGMPARLAPVGSSWHHLPLAYYGGRCR